MESTLRQGLTTKPFASGTQKAGHCKLYDLRVAPYRPVAFCYNNFIVSGSNSESRTGSIRFWNRNSGHLIGNPIVRNSTINAIAFSEDRTCVAAVYNDSYVCLWDVRTTCGVANHDVSSLPTGDSPDNYVTSIAFNSDGERVASGSEAGDVRVWDTKSGKCLAAWIGLGGPIFSVQFSPESNCLFAASRAGKLHVLYPNSRSEGQTIDITNALQWPIAIGREGKDSCIVIASPSPSMSESRSGHGHISVWSVSDGRCLEIGQLDGHEYQISAIAFSPDGRIIISASNDMTIRLWEVESIQQSEKSCRVVVLDGSYDGGPGFLGLEDRGVFSLLFSPNGETFVACIWAMGMWTAGTADDEDAYWPSMKVVSWFEIWDTRKCCRLFRSPHSQLSSVSRGWTPSPLELPTCADFSSNGQIFACNALNGIIEVWNVETFKRLVVRHLHHHDALGFVPVKISPDGRQMAAGSRSQLDGGDSYLKVWGVDSVEFQDLNFKSNEPTSQGVAAVIGVYSRRHTSDVDSGMDNSTYLTSQC